MEAFQRSADSGTEIVIGSRPDRPAAMPTSLQQGELD
jgi:hypothetical protein